MKDRKVKTYLIAGTAVTAGFLIIRSDFSLKGMSDAMALSGICFLIAALFWTARSLHFYDLIIYGFQKFTNLWKNRNFTQRTSEGYYEFMESRHYQTNYTECYVTAAVLLIGSAVLGLWL